MCISFVTDSTIQQGGREELDVFNSHCLVEIEIGEHGDETTGQGAALAPRQARLEVRAENEITASQEASALG